MGNLYIPIIFFLNTGLVVSKPVLVTSLEHLKDHWDVCRKKSLSAPPQVGGNGDADITDEELKGQIRNHLKVWIVKLCFNGKDFAKLRFISVAVIEGQLVSNSVPCSYILSQLFLLQ